MPCLRLHWDIAVKTLGASRSICGELQESADILSAVVAAVAGITLASDMWCAVRRQRGHDLCQYGCFRISTCTIKCNIQANQAELRRPFPYR